jgi:HSP20 family molecular chaperone IbpA
MATTTSSAPSATTRESTERTVTTLIPAVDIFETESQFVLLADMPGVAADGVEVLTARDTLIVRGRAERRMSDPDYEEFGLGEYRRTFLITEDLDAESVSAKLIDGVLRVEIQKSDRLKPRKIPVHAE